MAATEPATTFYDSGYEAGYGDPPIENQVETVTAALDAMVEALIGQRAVLDAQIAAAKQLRDALPPTLVAGPIWQG